MTSACGLATRLKEGLTTERTESTKEEDEFDPQMGYRGVALFFLCELSAFVREVSYSLRLCVSSEDAACSVKRA